MDVKLVATQNLIRIQFITPFYFWRTLPLKCGTCVLVLKPVLAGSFYFRRSRKRENKFQKKIKILIKDGVEYFPQSLRPNNPLIFKTVTI